MSMRRRRGAIKGSTRLSTFPQLVVSFLRAPRRSALGGAGGLGRYRLERGPSERYVRKPMRVIDKPNQSKASFMLWADQVGEQTYSLCDVMPPLGRGVTREASFITGQEREKRESL